jgi:hypothetical protein
LDFGIAYLIALVERDIHQLQAFASAEQLLT